MSSIELAGWVDRLAAVDLDARDVELIDQIAELERIKSACAAAQAALTVAFVRSRTAGLTAAQLRDEGTHRSIGAQIAIARRDSPFRGGRHVGLARALINEMPHTYRALRSGTISEWRATLLVRETACLTIADRGAVDVELAPRLGSMGDKQTAQAAALIAQRLDSASCVKRNRKAIGDRRVSIRPAPDTMAYVTALLPVAHGVAVYAALTRHANTGTATGDPRSRGQLMADELVHRITTPAPGAGAGTPSSADTGSADTDTGSADTDTDSTDTVPAGVSIDIQLVMTDRTLLGHDNEPANLTGYGPIPAQIARRLVRTAPPGVSTFIRRLFTNPDTGQLITGDAKRRTFTHTMRQFLIARDRTCRTPWCDAPIRHADHIAAHHHDGPTNISNGQGLCERCNYTKQSPGWRTDLDADGTGVTTTAPTGHTATSQPPPPPHSDPWPEISWIEAGLMELLIPS